MPRVPGWSPRLLSRTTLRSAAKHHLADPSLAAAAVGASAASLLERGDDVKVSTLRSYVNGLGARLKIIAVFDDGDAEIAAPIRIGPDPA